MHGKPGPDSRDSAVAGIVARLRNSGLRLTPQRVLLIELLVQHGEHVTADDIHRYALAHYEFLSVSTVYRTLEMLRDAGIVSETDLGDGKRHFSLLSDDLHHHAICRVCGAVVEVDDRVFESVRRDLLAGYGFTARIDHIALFGECAYCANAQAQEPDS